jgi:membrane protein
MTEQRSSIIAASLMQLRDVAVHRLRIAFDLLKTTFEEWSQDRAPRIGAALAYYSVFSIGPLLLIAISVAGLFFGTEAAQGRIVDEIKGTVGESVAAALQEILVNADQPGYGIGAAIIGIITLLFGASGVFGELQDALNTIWKVEPKPGRRIWGIIQDRFFSFTMVLGTGFLLLVSLVITAALSALGTDLTKILPGGASLWQAVNQVITLSVIALLFAMIFRYLPDAKVAWGDVWIGALLTAVFFTIGKFLLGWYLGQASTTSAYGAAGSLVVILLWVYYSAQILLFGAEFTRVYAERFGSGIRPAANAVAVNREAVTRQETRHPASAR